MIVRNVQRDHKSIYEWMAIFMICAQRMHCCWKGSTWIVQCAKSKQREAINKLEPCQIKGSLNALPFVSLFLWNETIFTSTFIYGTFFLLFVECFKFVRVEWWYFNLLLILLLFSLLVLFFRCFSIRHIGICQRMSGSSMWFKAKMRKRKMKNLPETSFIMTFIYLNYIYCVQMQFVVLNQLLDRVLYIFVPFLFRPLSLSCVNC